MARYQKGEVAAFAELVARHEKRLWNFIRRFVSDGATAEDLLQESLLQIHKALPSFRGESSLSSWASKITLNTCLKQPGRS